MKYTRYNHNNYNNNNKRRGGKNYFFLIGLAICIPLAIGIGMIFGPMLFKQNDGEVEGTKKPPIAEAEEKPVEEEKLPNENQETASNTSTSENGAIEGEKEKFFILQCGVYGKEENATKALNDIPKEFNGFVASDGEKFRVVAGIYNEEESKKKSDILTNAEIENVRIKSEVPVVEENGVKTSKITKAYMDILKSFENPETKSVNTTEFKKWTSELKNEKSIEENEDVKNLKEHINSLPENLERKDSQNSIEYLYNILNKYRV